MRKAYLIAGSIVAPVFIAGLAVYSFVTRRQRVRILLTDGMNKVLLVRGVISRGAWTLPGGGINRGEKAVAAAQRELEEEVGIRLPKSAFTYLWTLERPEVRIPYVALLYRARVKQGDIGELHLDPREIRDACWFSRSSLPMNLSREARAALSQTFDK